MRLPVQIFVLILFLMQGADAKTRLLISVTVPSQAWLVNKLAGGQVDVMTMIPTGHVAETAQPGPQKLVRSREADLHFIVGHPALSFESRYITGRHGSASGVDSSARVSMYDVALTLMSKDELERSDPHLWTSPSIMNASAESLTEKLIQLEPEKTEIFQKNLVKLQDLIRSTAGRIRQRVHVTKLKNLLVYHPAWGHFSRDFSLSQIAVESEGKAPGAGDLARLVTETERNNLHYIVCAPGAEKRRATIIARQLNVKVLTVDPMNSDWLRMMEGMMRAVEN